MKKILLVLALLLIPSLAHADTFGSQIILKRTDCSTITQNGLGCYDTDDHTLCFGNGSACVAVGGGTVTETSVTTFTNKRNKPRIYSTASTATLTPEIDTYDYFELTAQAAALNIANPSTSTPTGGEVMIIAITSDATPRALTYGTEYTSGGPALPSTTIASKTTTLGFKRNAGVTKWRLLAVSQE